MKRVPRRAAADAGGRRYDEAAALREALRRFERRSEDIARAHGLTTRSYLLLLMVKTSRATGRILQIGLQQRLRRALHRRSGEATHLAEGLRQRVELVMERGAHGFSLGRRSHGPRSLNTP